MNVLITGLSGLIGGLAGRDLSTGHNVSGLCRSRVPGYSQVNASITDYESILPAFRDVEVVVHLAAYRLDNPIGDLFRTNVDGTYNVFRAAAESGVRRVVFASSCGVVRGYLPGWTGQQEGQLAARSPLTAGNAPWPVRPYDASKVAGESVARVFYERFGLEVICVRIGKCVADDVPVDGFARPFWVSQRDVTHLLRACVEHPGPIGYEVLFGTSTNTPNVVEIESARAAVGYEPRDGCGWAAGEAARNGVS